MKKQLTLIIASLLGLASPVLTAQTVTGTWELLPGYSTPSNLVETPEFVYVKSSSSLCGYDKETGEVLALNASNRLNGNQISNFWYNPKERCLFVAHTDYNIDLVYDDGRTINVPDLRDATISSDKTIQDVSFFGDKAYVATKSGLLVVDIAHGAIIESALWGKDVVAVAVTEGKIVICIDKALYVGNRNGSLHNFDQTFSKAASVSANPNIERYRCMEVIGKDKLLINYSNTLHTAAINNQATDNATAISAVRPLNDGGVTGFAFHQVNKDGLTVNTGNKVFYFDADGNVAQTITADEISGKLAADWSGTGANLWLASANGYGQYKVDAKDYAIAPVRPAGTSGTNVGMLRQLSNGDILISNLPRTSLTGSSDGKPGLFNLYANKDIKVLPVEQRPTLYSFAVNPSNEDEILAVYRSYVMKYNVKTGEAFQYTGGNAPLESTLIFNDVKVDKDGNLWILNIHNGNTPRLHKALAGSWETAVKSEGWSKYTIPDFSVGSHAPRMVIDENNKIIIISGIGSFAAVQMPDSSKPLTTSTKSFVHSSKIDEDGNSMSHNNTPAITIDKQGWIWFGSGSGIYVVRNSKDMMQTNYAPMHPKVPRNDGTNLADYLLDNISISNIFVDENNEKWISTYGSGLYRVNADGTEIIERYSTEDSDIPSNNVYCVLADKNSNKVFVGTDQGLSIFHSTSAPAATNYDNVYAYPNPVTPDYTGYITITGLKANSLVKIADAAGNVFYETKSDGGLATWNGCDASGRRVKSGVYFVFASESGEAQSGAAVTKIVIVN